MRPKPWFWRTTRAEREAAVDRQAEECIYPTSPSAASSSPAGGGRSRRSVPGPGGSFCSSDGTKDGGVGSSLRSRLRDALCGKPEASPSDNNSDQSRIPSPSSGSPYSLPRCGAGKSSSEQKRATLTSANYGEERKEKKQSVLGPASPFLLFLFRAGQA